MWFLDEVSMMLLGLDHVAYITRTLYEQFAERVSMSPDTSWCTLSNVGQVNIPVISCHIYEAQALPRFQSGSKTMRPSIFPSSKSFNTPGISSIEPV
jgi:hypothetical protein